MASRDEPKLIFPGLAGFYERFAPYSYTLIRFATGAILVPHGVQKILNTPIAKFAPNIAAKGLPFAEALAYLTYFCRIGRGLVPGHRALHPDRRSHHWHRNACYRCPVPMAVRLLLDRPRI
jgi:hypothetical protein